MPDLGLQLPDGFTLVSFAERPDLVNPSYDFNQAVWPRYMLEDSTADEHWDLLHDVFTDYQLILLDADGRIAATNNSAPLWWDGTDDGLPSGWDGQFIQTAEDLRAGRAPNTLGALQIVVDPERRGGRLAGLLVEAMRANARAHGLSAVIACVRPTDKHRYPLTPIERYAFWTRDDGQPFDAWIRLHVRLGARIVRGSPEAMTIRGSVADWESWTGMRFPESGPYVLPVATNPIVIDRERDEGVYHDANVWVVHELEAAPR